MSLSCIVQTLWDLSNYNRGNSTFTCQLDQNECKLDQKHFIKKNEKNMTAVIYLSVFRLLFVCFCDRVSSTSPLFSLFF